MADEDTSGLKMETWLLIGFVTALLLSTSVIIVTSSNKDTAYSAYVTDADESLQFQQVSAMRSDLGDNGMGYDIANTMSTPMLVNDWREPHRTMLVIAGVEKPFDNAEADAIFDFVTEKGGKVIIASNSTNAQTVAEKFGVKYFDAPVVDPQRYYSVTDSTDTLQPADKSKLWTVASVSKAWVHEGNKAPCTDSDLKNEEIEDCSMPVLFHNPTAMEVLGGDFPERDVNILAAATPGSILASVDTDVNNELNGQLGGNNTGLIIRMDYSGIEVIERCAFCGDQDGEVSVTGSIVFVSDHSVLANHLWDIKDAQLTGKEQCDSDFYNQDPSQSCWGDELSSSIGSTSWGGNSVYFQALIRDMTESDNPEISTTVTRANENFYVVFDESRHVTSAASSPFTEAMGAIVMLTSDTMLKWLIVLNLMALLSIAIMVVPEKENWRHVFDLTRFRERPNKVDPNLYLKRVREAMMAKVRQFNDLTRDEMARKTPGEIQSMVKDPRLIELLYSQQRSYSNEELRQLLQQIRRWGK